MYNPGGDDNNFEYIEIYSDEFESITNFTVSDLYSKDTLIQIKSSNNNYHLIVEEVFNHSNINASIYSVGATIGNQLNNDEDIIVIENNES
ncbi:hypothetical protein HOD61_02785, partial [archaeon]|nr:hypothetical protein [archaeon]